MATKNKVQSELLRFLRAKTTSDVHVLLGSRVGQALRIDVERAIQEFLPSLGLKTDLRGLNTLQPGKLKDHESPLSLDNLLSGYYSGEFGSGRSVSLPVGAGHMAEFPDEVLHLCSGGPVPLILTMVKREGLEDYCLQAATPDTPAGRKWAAEIMHQLENRASTHSIYRRGTLVPKMSYDGEQPQMIRFVDLGPGAEIYLDPRIDAELESSLLSFLRHAEFLDEVNLGSQRGLLLCGEPGTGKTTTCRYLRHRLPDFTFLLVESSQILHLKGIFKLARQLGPSVVVIEDVDLVVQNRELQPGNPPLRDLLNAMDGLERRDHVAVILTSNSWQFIEGALADRPGRIDQVIFFERPSAEHRKVLLKNFTSKLLMDASMESLVKATDGLTPAELLEVTKRAVIEALCRRTGDGPPRVKLEDFRKAQDSIRTLASRVGSRKTIGIVPSSGSHGE